MTILEYCIEEVTRQGHDVKDFMDGGRRVAWMMNGWEWAVNADKVGFTTKDSFPDVADIIIIGTKVEAEANKHGIRTSGVRVGSTICPPPDEIVHRLDELWLRQDKLTPIEFYKEFEMIHPFVDGNGRTGKVLLNWLNGTLLKHPIFPPPDLWGRVIRNP